MYPRISLYGLHIYTFNVCVILAVLVAILVFLHQTGGMLEPTLQDTFIAMLGADIPFVIVGAVVHNKIVFADSWKDFIGLLHENTGIAFFGGFLGGFFGFMILYQIMLRRKISMGEAMELLASPLMIGHAIGRIGCLMGGCCFGKPFYPGIRFVEGSPAYQMYGEQPLFPTQLWETGILCVMFACSCRLERHKAEFYLISYSVLRFLLEFMRGDYRGNEELILSPAQWIAILLLLSTVFRIGSKKLKKHMA